MLEPKKNIAKDQLPNHVAVIMDGNGRWAKERRKNRIFGHRNGVKVVRKITEAAAELGIAYLTLYTFSTENWNRPSFEVNALMELLILTIGNEVKTLMDNNIQLKAIGNIEALPKRCYTQLKKAMEITKNNKRMILTLALNYSGRSEIVQAVQAIVHNIEAGIVSKDDINEALLSTYLFTKDIPDPELLIRTSGETRLSNFLLWQCAYTEFYFTPKYWPDFNTQDFYEAISAYQKRERRFGKTSEQITK